MRGRRLILTEVSELADELSLRGVAWEKMSTAIDIIRHNYEDLDRDLLDLMTSYFHDGHEVASRSDLGRNGEA